MRQSNQDREIQYEKFKLDTIEELQNVYRKELKDQNCHIEKLKSDRLDLVKENDELLDTIAGLNSELDTVKRKEKSKEMEIKMQFDQKLKEMVMYTEKVASPRKKLELTPEAPENVEKLKKELRETMRKQENDKERNQLIISELKLALKRLERNYKDAAIKLQSYTSYF
uniref:Cilia- and flagella-associated protein 157 n=1 Tax=Caenorhabditis tropicalis TaxID=1561998 RepID=A0A1I7TYX1_9PELO